MQHELWYQYTNSGIFNMHYIMSKLFTVTAGDILNSMALTKRHINDNQADYIRTMRSTRDLENVLTHILPCDLETFTWLKRNLHNIDIEKLSDMAVSRLFDTSVMHTLLCVISAILWKYPRDGYIEYATIESIRYFFTDLNILNRRDNNTVLTSHIVRRTYNNIPNFVLKVSNSPQYNSDNIHELVVGIYGTNRLRNIIPNFAYILGGFSCTQPIYLPGNNKVSLWCRNYSTPVVYTIYENIYPSITLKEYISQLSTTPNDIVKVYLQILLSLKIARDMIGFTHYDLHDENVLLRKIPSNNKFYIAYPYTNDTTYYIETDNIPTIIDYGFSHIVYNDKHYGKYGFLEYSVLPDSTYDAHDHYKILMFMLYNSIITNRQDITNVLTTIASDLFDESPNNPDFKHKSELFFMLPNIDTIRRVKHENVIDYLLSKFQDLYQTSPDSNIITIQCGHTSNPCVSVKDITRMLFRPNITPRIINLFNYYDTRDYITDINLESEISYAKQYLESIINQVNSTIYSMNIDTGSGIVGLLDSLVKYLSDMVLIYEYVNREISLLKLLLDISTTVELDTYKRTVSQHINIINIILDSIRNNEDFISNPNKDYVKINDKKDNIEFLRSKVWLLPSIEDIV